MLVLSRKPGERVILPTLGVEITVAEIRGQHVRLGITAPHGVYICREELRRRLQAAGLLGDSFGRFGRSERDEDGMAPVLA
jgi:carbon storage regulator CsrA